MTKETDKSQAEETQQIIVDHSQTMVGGETTENRNKIIKSMLLSEFLGHSSKAFVLDGHFLFHSNKRSVNTSTE